MRYIVLAAALMLAVSYSTFGADAAEGEDTIWVAVAVPINGTKSIGEYYGQAKKSEYEMLLSGVLKGFLTMQSIFFLSTDKKEIVRLQDLDGYGYTGQVSFKADTIIRVKPIRKEFIEKLKNELQAPAKKDSKALPLEIAPNAPEENSATRK